MASAKLPPVKPHPVRYYGGGEVHFITFSCYRRLPLLNSAARRDLFLRALEIVRQKYQFTVVGYVVMPEHVHLLVSEPLIGNLSTVLKALKQGVARQVSTRARKQKNADTPMYFWQARFYDFNVYTAKKRIEKLRYMHRNPVTRGLIEAPEDWRWSSYRFYAFGEESLVKVNEWFPAPLVLKRSAGS